MRAWIAGVLLLAAGCALLVLALISGEQSQCDWWRHHDPATYQLNCR